MLFESPVFRSSSTVLRCKRTFKPWLVKIPFPGFGFLNEGSSKSVPSFIYDTDHLTVSEFNSPITGCWNRPGTEAPGQKERERERYQSLRVEYVECEIASCSCVCILIVYFYEMNNYLT